MLKVGWFYRLIVCTQSVASNSKYVCCMCYSKGLEDYFRQLSVSKFSKSQNV